MTEPSVTTEYKTHNCPVCGAPFQKAGGIIVCEYCKAVFSEENKYGGDIGILLESGRADYLINKFEDARQKFAAVLKLDSRNAIANFYMLLCVNGIRHEFDKLSGKHIYTPMWHNPQSIFEGSHYEILMSAVSSGELPEETMLTLKELEDLRLEINSSLTNDKNYDVFICYKHTTEAQDGTTFDKDRAYSLHSKLTKLGCTPFCAGLDLSGDNVNPKIFNALLKSKVMFVLASRKEYVNPGNDQSIWICNEWQRFLRLKYDFIEHKDKQIIPLYFHPGTPYIFPPELRGFQAFEYNDITDNFEEFFENNLEDLLFTDSLDTKRQLKKSERERREKLFQEAEQARIEFEAGKRMEAIIDEKIKQIEEKQRLQAEDTKKRAEEETAKIEAGYKAEIEKLQREREELKNNTSNNRFNGDAEEKRKPDAPEKELDVFERVTKTVYTTASKIGRTIKTKVQSVIEDEKKRKEASKKAKEERDRLKKEEKERIQTEKARQNETVLRHKEFKAKNKRLRGEHAIKIKKEQEQEKHNNKLYKNERAKTKKQRKEYFENLVRKEKIAKLEKKRQNEEQKALAKKPVPVAKKTKEAVKEKANEEKKRFSLFDFLITVVIIIIAVSWLINTFNKRLSDNLGDAEERIYISAVSYDSTGCQDLMVNGNSYNQNTLAA